MELQMRVLLAVDGSTASDRAAALVANLSWPIGSTISVLTAYPGTAAMFSAPGIVMAADVIQETEDAMEAEARRMVGDVARKFSGPDISVETQVVRERAATAILDEAARDFDLIVLGNRGRGPFESAVLGSVSDEVANSSHRPVLVARRDRIKRVLVGVDGSDDAAAAVEVVRRWSILHGAHVQVISVADADPQWNPWLQGQALREAHLAGKDNLHAQHEALARETAAGLKSAGIKAEDVVADGNPAHRLVEAAVNWDADLIVVGHHGQSRLERLFVGSVARSVLYHAPCSVLIVQKAATPVGAEHE
jgi:nucleotide-binding universal stress UspA family protein